MGGNRDCGSTPHSRLPRRRIRHWPGMDATSNALELSAITTARRANSR